MGRAGYFGPRDLALPCPPLLPSPTSTPHFSHCPVGTVFTTIGYGNITPRTTPGQALSIVYAIVGIPLVLAILNQVSGRGGGK